MADFGATRREVETALGLLAHAGDIRPRGPNRAALPVKRRVRGDDGEGTLIVYDRPVELRYGDSRAVFLALEESLPGPVVRLSLDSNRTTAARVTARILDAPQRRIVIMDHRAEVADALADAGRAVVSAGVAGIPGRVSRVGVSHESLIRVALKHIFAAGHRRVSFPIWRKKAEVALAMRGWIADAYRDAGLKHAPDFDAPVIADDSPAGLHACVRALIRHTPPTAFVSSDFFQWQGTFMVLAEAGLRCPRDVSLVSISSSPVWETATPAQTCLRHPVDEIATGVRRALVAAERGAAPTVTLFEPIWVPGASLGTPRG